MDRVNVFASIAVKFVLPLPSRFRVRPCHVGCLPFCVVLAVDLTSGRVLLMIRWYEHRPAHNTVEGTDVVRDAKFLSH